eukprot:1526185-Rhodomonas_salina.2
MANAVAPFVYRACINGQYCNNSILYIAFLTWWTNSKVLTLCMDRGPLPASKSLPRFIASMFLPINIRDEPSKITKDDKNTSTNDIYRSPFARVSNRYVQFVAKVMAMSALAYATHRFWNDMTPFQWDVCLTFIMCVRPLTTFVHACRCLLRLSLSVCAHLRSFLPTDIAQVSQSVLPARHVRSHRFHLLRRPTRASMLLSPQYQQRHTTGDRSIIVLMVPMCYLYA